MRPLEPVDVHTIILAGGKGTRLAGAAGDVPKVMAPIDGKPFLYYLIAKLKRQGFTNICLAVGHKSEQIKGYFGGGEDFGVTIRYSDETRPLGTGGAIRNAIEDQDQAYLVLNGDSYLETRLVDFLSFHEQHHAELSLTLVTIDNPDRFGTVVLDEHDRIIEFREKVATTKPSLINAGIYLFSGSMLSNWERGVHVSFENEMLPSLLNRQIYGFSTQGYFVDIGIPEAYLAVQSRLPI